MAYGNLGYSHHAIQDYALMRSFPNMLIAAPGDPMEVRACLRYLVSHPQPSYLRLGKAGEPNFHRIIPEVSPGGWLPVRDGCNQENLLLSTGGALGAAIQLAGAQAFQSYSVYSVPLWGMRHKNLQKQNIRSWSRVVTLEDHLADGGFGSWLLESFDGEPSLQERVTLRALDPSICAMVAGQTTLMEMVVWRVR